MPTEDETRRELFDLLEAGISSRGAALLMTYLPPTGWANLATKDDLGAMRAELKGEMAELRGELKAEIGVLKAEIGVLSGKIDGLDSRMGAQVSRLVAANVATIIGLAGFGAGAVALFS